MYFLIIVIIILWFGTMLYLHDRKKFNDGVCKVCRNDYMTVKFISICKYKHKCDDCGYSFNSNWKFKSTREIKFEHKIELGITNLVRNKNGLSTIETYKEYKKLYK